MVERVYTSWGDEWEVEGSRGFVGRSIRMDRDKNYVKGLTSVEKIVIERNGFKSKQKWTVTVKRKCVLELYELS